MFPKPTRHRRESNEGEPNDQALGSPPLINDPVTTPAPPSTGREQHDPTQPRRRVLKPQDEDSPPAYSATDVNPSNLVVVETEMTVSEDRPTRQTARHLNANMQGEEGARQETATGVGSADGLDKDDTVSADGATTHPDEVPITDDPGQCPNRKNMK